MGVYFLTLMALRGQRGDALVIILALPVLGLVGAVVFSIILPSEDRGAFWAQGVLCILAAALMWGISCNWAMGF